MPLSVEPPFVHGDASFREVVLLFFFALRESSGGVSRRCRRRMTSRCEFLCTGEHESERKYHQKAGNFTALSIDPRLVALSVRFADFCCCCLPCPRTTSRVRCGHYRLGATETVVQTENRDLFVSAAHQSIENCLLYPLMCDSPARDAPFRRTFCFRLCVPAIAGCHRKSAVSQNRKWMEIPQKSN